MPLPQEGTLLQLLGMGVPLYSTRGCTQTLDPIEAAKVHRRTINGALIDLSFSAFHKYRSEVTCKDRRAPALSGIWPGRQITVYCVAELAFLTIGGVQERPAVPGSSYVEGLFTRFLPILQCRVIDFAPATAEWEADVQWKLILEEI